MKKISSVTSGMKQVIPDKKPDLPPVPIQSVFKDGCPADCSECGGQSYIRFQIDDIKHPLFGKMFPCNQLPITSSRYDSMTGLAGVDRTHAFSEIDDVHNIREAVEAVVSLLKKGRGLVLLHGEYGLGKTLLLKIAVSEVLKQRKYKLARYRMMADIIEEMRETFDTTRSLRELLAEYTQFNLLCIDELGVERDTPFAAEKQFALIDGRYEAAIERGEPIMTIIATNKPLHELPGRLVDNFKDGRCACVNLTGKSYRPGQT